MIPGNSYRSFSTPDQIRVFCEALFDRYSYGEGLSTDPEVTEPGLVWASKRRHTFVLPFDGEALDQADVPTRW